MLILVLEFQHMLSHCHRTEIRCAPDGKWAIVVCKLKAVKKLWDILQSLPNKDCKNCAAESKVKFESAISITSYNCYKTFQSQRFELTKPYKTLIVVAQW